MKTYERDVVIYITAPALDIGSCNGCAANDLSIEPDCAGFPAASFNNEDHCYGCIWIKSPEQKEMNKDWLNELKKGDKVIEVNRYDKNIVTVDRTTNTQIVIKVPNTFTGLLLDEKYNKSTGHKVAGDSFNYSYLTQATDEEIQKVEQQKKDSEIKEWFKAKKFTLDEIKRIKELIGG